MTTTSESLLVRLKNHRDAESWHRFVSLYTPMIFRWARQTGMQVDDASDLVQDVLSTLLRRISSFQYDPGRSFRGWLRKVTINQYRMNWRRNKGRDKAQLGSWLSQIPDQHSLESSWDISYRVSLVEQAMQILKPDFAERTWTALRDLIINQSAVEEVAKRHSISIWTLYSARTRLLQRMKQILDGLLD